MAFSLSGSGGSLRVGVRPAATFGTFTFSQVDPTMGGGYRIDAAIATADEYWLEDATTYDLVLPLRRSTWRFRHLTPAEVTINLGERNVTIRTHQTPEDA